MAGHVAKFDSSLLTDEETQLLRKMTRMVNSQRSDKIHTGIVKEIYKVDEDEYMVKVQVTSDMAPASIYNTIRKYGVPYITFTDNQFKTFEESADKGGQTNWKNISKGRFKPFRSKRTLYNILNHIKGDN